MGNPNGIIRKLNKETMTLEQFKKYCQENDYNIVSEWDFKRFDIVCKKCGSTDCQIGHKTKKTAEGSEYTGTYTVEEGGLLVKCIDCGNAITLMDPDKW